MTRFQWLHPMALILLTALLGQEARAQHSMGKTVPSSEQPTEDTEAPAPPESPRLELWKTLNGDGAPMAFQFVRAGASTPSRMTVVKRGDLAITEGDMVVGPYDKVLSDFSKENAIKDPYMKWAKVNGKVVVPFRLGSGLPRETTAAVQQAIAEFNAKTCVRFIPQTLEQDYVTLFYGNGCYSYVGNIHQGMQELSLGQGCEFKGTAVHELMHVLGFYHEQSRPDRDQYITIRFQNVAPDQAEHLDICQDCTTQGLPYDYASIMHLGSRAFTANGNDTLVPKQPGASIVEPYDKPGLTPLDVKKIHKLYQCQ
jgi:hypothetical protein